MALKGERSVGPAAVAKYDQAQAKAIDYIKNAKGYFLVAMDEDGNVVAEFIVGHNSDDEGTVEEMSLGLLAATATEVERMARQFENDVHDGTFHMGRDN